MNIRTSIAACCLELAIGAPHAHAVNTPMQEYLRLERTDYVVAGAGGIGAPLAQGGGSGSLHLEGLSGTVTLALLYWNGIDIEWPVAGLTGGDANYDQPQIHFDGHDVSGTRVGGSGSNDCWPSGDATLQPSAATWRADVTDRVSLRGNGDYAFSGLADKPGHSANGLSLIVYFNDGNPANDVRVTHYEGLQSNTSSAHFEFAMDYTGDRVEAVLHASDGQSQLTDGSLIWKTLPGRPDHSGVANTLQYRFLHDGLSLWPGSSVPNLGHQRNAYPASLWDIRRMPLTPLFGPPHHYTTQFDYPQSGQDCISLHVIQIVQPADPQAPMLSPNPHDFGDVIAGSTTPPQHFTFTNLMPGPVNVQAPTIADSQFHIVAQTCSGQTLAVGAACTIDVTFAPAGAQPLFPRTTLLLVPFTDAAFSPNAVTVYATVQGTGVPATTFSRLSFEPRSCTFKPTAVGATSAAVRINARSSGSLPLTLGNVTVGGTRFALVATTCTTGLSLPPGAACTLDIAFHPGVAGSNVGTARIEYTASDAPPGSEMSMQFDGEGTTASEPIFADGFEWATCVE